MIIISRFILNLRRFDQKRWLSEPHFSHLRIRVTSREGFLGEMGQPLDYGFSDLDDTDSDDSDLSVTAPSCERSTTAAPVSHVTFSTLITGPDGSTLEEVSVIFKREAENAQTAQGRVPQHDAP